MKSNNEFKIIELVGPPGSGKSSLTERLRACNPNIHVESFPYYRRPNCIPFYVRNLAALLPTLLTLKRDPVKGWVSPRDLVSMIILNGWARELRQKLAKEPSQTLVLDEGAITISGWLKGFGSTYMESEAMRAWWQRIYAEWGATLDLVIQFQTPAPVLMQRIRQRDHNWDHRSDQETLAALETMKFRQDEVLGIFSALPGSPRVIRVSTLEKSAVQIGDEVLQQIGWK